MAKIKNQITAIKYDIVTVEIETAMLTPPGYQHRQNNKQTKTNILYTLKTNKTKKQKQKIFFFFRICLPYQNNTISMQKLIANKTKIINAISRQ